MIIYLNSGTTSWPAGTHTLGRLIQTDVSIIFAFFVVLRIRSEIDRPYRCYKGNVQSNSN